MKIDETIPSLKDVLDVVLGPETRALVQFPSYRSRDWWVRECADILKEIGGAFYAKECYWSFPSGALVWLIVLSNDEDIDKLRGRIFTDAFTTSYISSSKLMDALRYATRRVKGQ